MQSLKTHVDLYIWIVFVVAIGVAVLYRKITMDAKAFATKLDTVATNLEGLSTKVTAPGTGDIDSATETSLNNSLNTLTSAAKTIQTTLGIPDTPAQ